MLADLRKIIADTLLMPAADLGLRIVMAEGKPWTYQTVELVRDSLRIRVQRERGIVEVLFGSLTSPTDWFDSSEIIQLLTGEPDTLTSSDAEVTISSLRDLLRAMLDVLVGAFSETEYPATRMRLFQLRKMANEQLAPGRPSKAE